MREDQGSDVAPDRPEVDAQEGASTKPLLAYMVSDEEGWTTIVYAKTNAHARTLGYRELDSDWWSVRARRCPRYDSLYPAGPSAEDLFNDGWNFECQACGMPAYADNGGVCDGRVFYCEGCALSGGPSTGQDEAAEVGNGMNPKPVETP